LTLTAEPEDGTLLRHWRIYDPNYPGDGNYVQTDTNNPLVVMLDTDWEIHASFQCAPNVHQSLPLSAIAIGLCGLVARRMRRRR